METREGWRLSISITPELEQRIINLRKDDKFTRMSWGEIVRCLIRIGLDNVDNDEQRPSA